MLSMLNRRIYKYGKRENDSIITNDTFSDSSECSECSECYVCYHDINAKFYECPVCKSRIHNTCYDTMVSHDLVACGICREPYKTFNINSLYINNNLWRKKEIMVYNYISYDTLKMLSESITMNRFVCGVIGHGNVRAIGYLFVGKGFIGVIRMKGRRVMMFRPRNLMFCVALFDSPLDFNMLERKYDDMARG